jgi:nucleoside-diphosphate-sugar epimerase
VKYAPPRSGDIRDSQADISLAREVLGYNPRVGFEEGLKHTFGWFCATQEAALPLNLSFAAAPGTD